MCRAFGVHLFGPPCMLNSMKIQLFAFREPTNERTNKHALPDHNIFYSRGDKIKYIFRMTYLSRSMSLVEKATMKHVQRRHEITPMLCDEATG